jgi:TIR domain
MSRCFISYRHVFPDQDLAQAIGAALTRGGHTVFLDTKMTVGVRWGDAIEREIGAADFFVVLLSEQSIQSDMVRQEVELAYLPVRVACTATLPYDLAAYLNRLQYSVWNAGEPYDRLCAEIESAINGRESVRQAVAATPPVAASLPTPAVVPFQVEGLDRVTKELAIYVGPMARVLVNRAAKKAQTWKQLYDSLAEEVPAGPERQRFLAQRTLR